MDLSLPHDDDAELAVIGAALLDDATLHELVLLVNERDFFRESHRFIYRTIRDLYDLGKAIDATTLIDEPTKRGHFEEAGGDETIRTALEKIPSDANPKRYAQIVKGHAISRELIEASNLILRDAYSNNCSGNELIHSAERRIFAIAEGRSHGEPIRASEAIVKLMDMITNVLSITR